MINEEIQLGLLILENRRGEVSHCYDFVTIPCLVQKVTQKDEIPSGNAIPNERKKITFADEAGGVLCHVKFIEDDMTSLDSKS